MWAYLKFLFRSFHLHGIHSPFVYQLEKNCFHSKKDRVVPNLIDYLKIERLLVVGFFEEQTVEKNVKNPVVVSENELDAFLEQTNAKFDMVLFQQVPIRKLFSSFQKIGALAHNDTVFIFEKIHRSKEMEVVWKKIVQSEKVRVSIDTFYFGLLFFRKEQAKENFTIRIG